MKKILTAIALAAFPFLVQAQSPVIKISGTRLAYPLFNYWASEFSKAHPGTGFKISSDIAADSSDIVIASYAVQPGELKPGQQLIAVSEYVQLPVVNSRRSDLYALQQKGFTEGSFRNIYFGGAGKKTISTSLFTVYTRERPVCATKAFAGHFGMQPGAVTGVGVKGDDNTLLDAVKKDTNAISYNNLGFIYNLQTRKVNDSIAIIPIDINENGRTDSDEKIYNTLDEVVAYVQKSHSKKFVSEKVNVIISRDNVNAAVVEFIGWVLKEGQQYANAYGFIQLPYQAIEDGLAFLSTLQYKDLDAMYGKQN